jgi:D-lactate dehydrogenase
MLTILHLDLNLIETDFFNNPQTNQQLNQIGNQLFLETKSNLEGAIQNNSELANQAEILTIFIHHKFNAQVLASFPNLKLICTRSTGFDHIDLEYCKNHRIAVCNVPDYGSNTVAEHTFALLLNISKQISKLDNRTKTKNYKYLDLPGFDLWQKPIGLIGVSGKIGKNAAQIARGFDMQIYGCDVFEDDFLADTLNVKYLTLEELLNKSEIISMHAPLFPSTKGMLNKENLSKIEKGKIFINTSRGGLISNADLLWALDEGVFAFAGLDAIENEPELFEGANTENAIVAQKITTHPNVVFTPHSAYYTTQALTRIAKTTLSNIQNFGTNKFKNLAN